MLSLPQPQWSRQDMAAPLEDPAPSRPGPPHQRCANTETGKALGARVPSHSVVSDSLQPYGL